MGLAKKSLNSPACREVMEKELEGQQLSGYFPFSAQESQNGTDVFIQVNQECRKIRSITEPPTRVPRN
jgi:hypothetical protein